MCEPLQFREGQLVISLMAGVPLSDIQRWCGPAVCSLACPLPAIAENAGTTIVTPPEPRTVAVFEKLGTAVPVSTEDQFKRLQAMTCVMGDLYARQKTAQDWLVANGVDATAASAYVGGVFHTMTHDARKRKTVDLIRLGRGADAGRHERDGHRRAAGGRRLHVPRALAGLDLLAAVRRARSESLAPAANHGPQGI